MNKALIAIDPGKHTCKAICKTRSGELKRVSFRSKLLSLNNALDMEAQGNSFKVTYNEKTYIIGDQGEESSYSVSKADLCHQLAAYTSISQLREGNSVIQLALGCPVSIYKNRDLRDEYKKYILGDKYINLDVNGKSHAFLLENALILPEGSGIVYTHPILFKGKRVAVIDLGGLNMNFMVFDNLIPEISSMFTVNHGSNELETSIVNELSSKLGITLSSKDAAYIIKQGGIKLKGQIDTASTIIVDELIQNHITRILQEIRKNNYTPDTLDMVFVGGTSLLLRDKLLESFQHAVIVDNAQWCNAEGFLRIGEIKYGKAEENIG